MLSSTGKWHLVFDSGFIQGGCWLFVDKGLRMHVLLAAVPHLQKDIAFGSLHPTSASGEGEM